VRREGVVRETIPPLIRSRSIITIVIIIGFPWSVLVTRNKIAFGTRQGIYTMKSNQGNSNDSSFAPSSDQYRVAGADGQSSKDGTATSAPAGFILPELISDSSEPRPPEQVADFRDLEEGKKVRDKKLDEMQNTPLHPQTTSTSNEFDDVPIPPAQVAAQQETMEENKKKNNIFSASNIVAEAEEPSGTRKSVSPMHLVNSSSTQSANGPTHANDLDNNGSRTHESSEQRHQSNIHLIEATLWWKNPPLRCTTQFSCQDNPTKMTMAVTTRNFIQNEESSQITFKDQIIMIMVLLFGSAINLPFHLVY